jgi:proteasome accessory factor B
LETLQSVGFPIESSVGPNGRKSYRVDGDWSGPPLTFPFDQALALYLGRRFLEPLAGTVFWEAAQLAFERVRASLREETLAYVEKMTHRFHHTLVGAGRYAEKADVLEALSVAIEDEKIAHIVYQSEQATEPAERDVYPYGIVEHRGSLYLVAYAPERNALRHYKIDRIDAAELTEFTFQRPEDFDLSKHLSGSFGVYQESGDVTVRLRFVPSVARYVKEKAWHPSQQLEPQRDGGLIASFRLAGVTEIKSWLLSFGPQVEVLEPDSLRSAVANDAIALANLYSTQSPRPTRPKSVKSK